MNKLPTPVSKLILGEISGYNLPDNITAIRVLCNIKEVPYSVLLLKVNTVSLTELISSHPATACKNVMPIVKLLTLVFGVQCAECILKFSNSFFDWQSLNLLFLQIGNGIFEGFPMSKGITNLGNITSLKR